MDGFPAVKTLHSSSGPRGVVSYVAIDVEGLGSTRVGRLLRVSRQSVLRGVEIGKQMMIKNGWELKSFRS